MIQFKNLSPRQVSAVLAFSIAALVGLANFVLVDDWKIALASFAVLFLVAYLLIFYFLQQFIYRRIKLIYKFIYQTKATKREEFYNKYIIPQKSIDEVKEDVEKWAEQRQGEIELLRKNEAFRKDFLQNLAHEFKTPIFAIQGYIDTLLGGAMENPEVRKRFLENASRNVDRLVNLMNDLDEISRLESGEQILYKQYFIMQDLIREVLESLSIKLNQREISAAIKKGCEAPVYVFADKEKIRQVMINLVSNATKYGKPGGSIIISVYNTDEFKVLVEVSDDGIGIEESHLSRIFERFYRTDKARSRDKGGTGLGLAICKHIIEAHGESMHVRSKPEVGTTIGFTLSSTRGEE